MESNEWSSSGFWTSSDKFRGPKKKKHIKWVNTGRKKNWTPLRWEIKHGGKREDLLEFAAAPVKDSARTLCSVWKHYPNDTAVGRQTYAAVWIQPNFLSTFTSLLKHFHTCFHWWSGTVATYWCTRCVWARRQCQDLIYELNLFASFLYYFYLPQPFVPHWFSAGNRYFQSPLGVDAWCIWCTLSVFFPFSPHGEVYLQAAMTHGSQASVSEMLLFVILCGSRRRRWRIFSAYHCSSMAADYKGFSRYLLRRHSRRSSR